MFKTKKSRIPAVYRMLLVAIAVMAIGGIAVNCYVGNYYRADSIAKAAIDSDREISVTIEKKDKRIQATQYDLKHKNYTITLAPQDKEKATKALIFYPGGRVQYTAYAPLMHELAKNNFVCILNKFICNFYFIRWFSINHNCQTLIRISITILCNHTALWTFIFIDVSKKFFKRPNVVFASRRNNFFSHHNTIRT